MDNLTRTGTDLKPENVMLTLAIRGSRGAAVAAEAAEAAAAAAPSDPPRMGLTKNQKKKAKRKAKKATSGGVSQDDTGSVPEEVTGTEGGADTATSAAAETPAEAAGRDAHEGSRAEPSAAHDSEPAQEADVVEESPEAFDARLMDNDARIVDFGNACWTHKHFTDDIQTRQYRSPEVCTVTLKRPRGIWCRPAVGRRLEIAVHNTIAPLVGCLRRASMYVAVLLLGTHRCSWAKSMTPPPTCGRWRAWCLSS